MGSARSAQTADARQRLHRPTLVRARALRKANAYLSGQLTSLDAQRAAVLKELRENRQQLEHLQQPWEAIPRLPLAELAATRWNERALRHVDAMPILSQWGHLTLESAMRF